jgi:hypothetical protein
MARPLHLAWALVLGACFTGGFLAGQPCMSDADCGPSLKCDGGFCGGASAGQTSAPETTSTSVDPTTTDVDPTTTGVDPTTTTTVDPTTTTTTTTDDSTGGPTCGLGRCKDFDVLFVIDNSTSMQDDFGKLISALGPFTEHLLPAVSKACSVHLGVVTTDQYMHNPPGCQALGNLVQATDGGTQCVYKEGFPYATLADLKDPTSLACILTVGSDGAGDEKPIDAMFSAIDPDINASDCNQGFYRPDAFLAVVLSTDEDDDDADAQGHSGSSILPTDTWFPLLSSTKPGGIEDVYVTAFLGDKDPAMANCPWAPLDGPDGTGSEHAPVLREFVEKFGPDRHALGSLCDAGGPVDYEPLIMEIVAEITAACEG